jgi:hypothetical protein
MRPEEKEGVKGMVKEKVKYRDQEGITDHSEFSSLKV